MIELQDRASKADKELSRMKERLKEADHEGVTVDGPFANALRSLMKESTPKIRELFAEGTFRRLFWDEQLKSAEKDLRQMRWHPTIIR